LPRGVGSGNDAGTMKVRRHADRPFGESDSRTNIIIGEGIIGTGAHRPG
jgi:hypothetical protein